MGVTASNAKSGISGVDTSREKVAMSGALPAGCCSRPAAKMRNPWIHIPIGYGKLFKNSNVELAL